MATVAEIIQPKDVETVWLSVRDYIARCDTDVSTAEDLYPLLLDSRRTLVLVTDEGVLKGACVIRFVNGFANKALITTLGGDGGNWNKAIGSLIEQLRDAGYERLEIQGRKGWLRSLEGFTEMHTIIGRDI